MCSRWYNAWFLCLLNFWSVEPSNIKLSWCAFTIIIESIRRSVININITQISVAYKSQEKHYPLLSPQQRRVRNAPTFLKTPGQEVWLRRTMSLHQPYSLIPRSDRATLRKWRSKCVPLVTYRRCAEYFYNNSKPGTVKLLTSPSMQPSYIKTQSQHPQQEASSGCRWLLVYTSKITVNRVSSLLQTYEPVTGTELWNTINSTMYCVKYVAIYNIKKLLLLSFIQRALVGGD